ncbi:SH2 domain protein [Dictyocaulus viviparus]|uniref:Tyrosine-protein kinase n=1 Tax=Dictyocaulus viviparus TaxID=29172 RepID=A0A0D8Y2T5_DICVI|nr:SH2 domain protein [Dictyocaulus viviparus]
MKTRKNQPPTPPTKSRNLSALKKLNFYHGYLPREDVVFLLHYVGEFLLRLSEVESESKHPSKREIILSVVCEGEADAKHFTPAMQKYEKEEEQRIGIKKYARKRGKVRNIVVHRQHGKYLVETKHVFDSLSDLIQHYKTKPCSLTGTEFTLQYPIPHQSWEYYHSDLQLGKVLGEGAYGMVRSGTLRSKANKTIQVAIKQKKPYLKRSVCFFLHQSKTHTDLGKAKIKEMMNEARLMRLFQVGGALNSFLRTQGKKLDVNDRITLCVGAASGVEYLHLNECIHRDLAARNCLITEEKVVKISDFGLSRIGTQYKLKTPMKLPIKWLAPESIETFTFSLKTDVFSFGVLAYEVFTNGGEPWDGMTNAEVKVAVSSGKFLIFPNTCPERLRNFFSLRVFAKDSSQRATMSEVMKTLRVFLT